MTFFITPAVRDKLTNRHQVTEQEIVQCFANREGKFLVDEREEHRTTPPTQWFISETDYGRLLKICFVMDGGIIEIKTAYTPNAQVVELYRRKCG